MSGGRGSALVVGVVVLAAVAVVFHCEVAEAATYKVGGTGGWTFNVAGWPKGKRFRAGDTLGKRIPVDSASSSLSFFC